jgi:hypothetical protein
MVTPVKKKNVSLFTKNMMNTNVLKKSMLGKRKNGRTVYEQTPPKKRTDLTMVANINRISEDMVKIKLPQQLVRELQRVNQVSSANRIEYAGKIEFDLGKNGSSILKFKLPTRNTTFERSRVGINVVQLLKDSYITYHTHPAVSKPMNNMNGNNSRAKYVTLPSGLDFEAYIRNYPKMQANIIADAHGYYVIDLIEAGRQQFTPNPATVNRAMEGVRSRSFFQDRLRTFEGLEYYETTYQEWRKIINIDLNAYMMKYFGISVKYYTYTDIPATITLVNK